MRRVLHRLLPPASALLVTSLVTLVLARAQGRPAYLPDPRLTPGAVFPAVTTARVCQPGYPASVRNVPASVRAQVFRRYGIVNPRPGQYDIDHLIPLEIGGSNAITNLWPQPTAGPWNSHIKDRLENELRRRVCSGQMTMRQAQQEIARDWVAAYRRYLGNP